MYKSVEIDFDVFKALTIKRSSASVTENDVLRGLLNLPPLKQNGSEIGNKVGQQSVTENVDLPHGTGKPFIAKGVEFPHGTEFRMKYRAQWFYGKISDGALLVNNKRYTAVSKPACDITGTSINGWICWECKFPGAENWQAINTVRNRRRD